MAETENKPAFKPDQKPVEMPRKDRMVRAASTRDVIGRDPKHDVVAGNSGIVHLKK